MHDSRLEIAVGLHPVLVIQSLALLPSTLVAQVKQSTACVCVCSDSNLNQMTFT